MKTRIDKTRAMRNMLQIYSHAGARIKPPRIRARST